MTTRVKKTIDEGYKILSRETAERALGELSDSIFKRDGLKAEMERRILAVRNEYEKQVFELDLQVDIGMKRLEQWATENPAEFGGKKSIDMLHGTLGFRTCPPALKTLSKWTMKTVLKALKDAGLTAFVRTKEEVDKDAILAEHAAKDDAGESRLPAEKLRTFGLQVKQDETFFVEPKQEAF